MIRYGLLTGIILLATSLQCRIPEPEESAALEPADAASAVAVPDPLILQDGSEVGTVEVWETMRKREIAELFAEHMYGVMPPAAEVASSLEDIDASYLDGKATRKQVRLSFGPEGTPPIHLLVVIPNEGAAPPPVFLGLNFHGNQTVVNDPDIPVTEFWVPERGDGVEDNRATEASRGTSAQRWSVADVVLRGYALATFYHGDVDPDFDDFSNGVHAHIPVAGSTERTDDSWGTIAAWAWGLHRAVDYLIRDPDVDGAKIAVMGHSRNGKAALLAGATDARIALVVSNQSGCGGAALSKRQMGETVEAINTRFPHWFNRNFRQYNGLEENLPLDQHLLIASIAPRPVLVASAEEDLWADPEGEFQALLGAESVYALYGKSGVGATEMPPTNTLIGSTLGYHIRPGGHGVGPQDWNVFMDFADLHFGRPAGAM